MGRAIAPPPLKSHPLLAELAGVLLHEVNNSAQYIGAVDALAAAIGPTALDGREADLQECAAQLAAQAAVLHRLAGGASDPLHPVCDTLGALVRKKLQRERRHLRIERSVPVLDADALDSLEAALAAVRSAPDGARFVLRFAAPGRGLLSSDAPEESRA